MIRHFSPSTHDSTLPAAPPPRAAPPRAPYPPPAHSAAPFPLGALRRVRWPQARLRLLLRALWLVALLWGERGVWQRAVARCAWERWERWPAGAVPYRMALVADPQLVDVHTYARRGVALAATVAYADRYLARAWRLLHAELAPSEAVFLGDLFDGGREWAVPHGDNNATAAAAARDPHAAPDWARHGHAYWLGELRRWQRIFTPPPGVRVRTGLPGNHDLGFGAGVKLAARDRFAMFFGPANARWAAGNHTWVMVDTVSLSHPSDAAVYGPARDFLEALAPPSPPPLQAHAALTAADDAAVAVQPSPSSSSTPADAAAARPPPPHAADEQPAILLTHVPLYRPPATPCGPLRESGGGIKIWRGFQYQNVLAPALSAELLRRTGARYVFSGDDHDACAVTHMYGSRGIVHEWTVKSASFCMGVRHPGLQLVSLWNPGPGAANAPGATLQARLCVLPDQIGIFLSYAWLLLATVLVLCAHVWRRRRGSGGGARGGVGGGSSIGGPSRTGGVLPQWKGIPDAAVDDDGGDAKYWKPAASRRGDGRRLWLWFIRAVLFELAAVAAVVVPSYVFLLWRW